ncbi:helix-turn-helix domain-containing protein [Larsenimonas suaedae]|uniref:Helix-turn-helix domain-containing protein n=1 Tax=Larsenimonas suaedae TaxID=1851019 RepID=A0ABU1GY07_9GAMM|nr:helix-turn-helix domain-containing protein [Larsenimonas suaedae]MCM2973325.1 helix-turn-helix domain-containing protein [Larsenimonas suaedae]MDR5896218.1 helix-turn-helix domain-containing protein [Larsenimonas suaedae]
MTITLHHCLDATEHAQRLDGWQQESSQIEAGCFSGEIVDVVSREVRLFRESANLELSQRMHFPESQWHLVTPIRWSNSDLYSSDAVTVLPSCDQFWSVAPSNYDLLVASIDRSRHPWLGRDEHRLRRLEVPKELLNQVRGQWQGMTDYLRQRPAHELMTPTLQQSLMRQLEDSIELLLSECVLAFEPDVSNYRTRRYIVDRCQALLRSQPEDPPSLMALCDQLKISRRTLQYSFQAEVGQSPVNYLRALRLNAVRRNLLQDPTQRLADAAAGQGFFHQSYFCREYRRLFQELPSATRDRALEAARPSVA